MSLHLHLHESSDYANGTDSFRSVSGAVLALVGPRSFFPIMAKTAEHGCVGDPVSAIATASGDVAIEAVYLRTMSLWDIILGRPTCPDIVNDKNMTIRTVKSG